MTFWIPHVQPSLKPHRQRSETYISLNTELREKISENDNVRLRDVHYERTEFIPPASLCSDLYQWSDNPISEPIAVCGSPVHRTHSIKCYKSSIYFPPPAKSMLGINSTSSVINVTCTLENFAVSPIRGNHKINKYLRSSSFYRKGATGLYSSHLNLLSFDQSNLQCPVPTLKGLELSLKNDDVTRRFVVQTLRSKAVDPSICESWVNETAYFYVNVEPYNIYFIFLRYYNIYHSVMRTMNKSSGNIDDDHPRIIRFDGVPNLKFKDFEDRFFSQLTSTPQKLNFSQTVCFRKIILVPRSYNSLQFQCVERKDVRNLFMSCSTYLFEQARINGGVSSLLEFRTKVFDACGITSDSINNPLLSHPKQMLFIQRKPYVRNGPKNIRPSSIQRELSNEAELLSMLAESFPSLQINITAVSMETFDICTQIRMANSADILMGVHGAGLVHLWWMKEDGWVLELVPKKKENKAFMRPTYKVLSAMLGRNYHDVPSLDRGIRHDLVSADVNAVVKTLRTVLEHN